MIKCIESSLPMPLQRGDEGQPEDMDRDIFPGKCAPHALYHDALIKHSRIFFTLSKINIICHQVHTLLAIGCMI